MSSYTYPQSGLAISLEWESKILLLNAFFLLIGAQLQLCIWAYSHAQYKVCAYALGMKHSLIICSLPAVVLCGCASSPLDDVKTVPFTNPAQLAALPVHPHAEAYPVSRMPSHAGKSLPIGSDPLPVWENTQIQKVLVDAYVDERGNLHPESYMYVVTKKGGWNMDAVRKPEAYIPPENAAKPLSGFGVSYGLSSALPQRGKGSASMAIAGADKIRITGYMESADAAKARELADPASEIAIFDPKLGWVVVPRNTMASEISAPNAFRENPRLDELPDESGRIGSPPKRKDGADEQPKSLSSDLFNEI